MRGRHTTQTCIPILFQKNFKLSEFCKSKINVYPRFYPEVISLWEKVCIKGPVDIAEAFAKSIWNNYFFKKKDSTLCHPELYSRGIPCIKDIVDEQVKILT